MAKGLQGSKSQRAERIDLVRNLVGLGVSTSITSRSQLIEEADRQGFFRRENNRASLKYSSAYRYLDALRFLKFDISERYGKDENIVWSPEAYELASVITAYDSFLSDQEKKILRMQILKSSANEQFLSIFCSPDFTLRTEDDFTNNAYPLYVIRSDNEASSKEAKEIVELRVIPEDPGSKILKPENEFLYTYRYWCLDSGFIDELNVKEAERCGIPKVRAYALFPIERQELSSKEFLNLIYLSLDQELQRPITIQLPLLMYKICIKYKIAVEQFKRLIIETSKEHPEYLHLERGPGGLLTGIDFIPISYSDRYGNHRYYIKVNGTIRTNISIFPYP